MSCRSSGGRAFHTLGPAAEKLLSPKLLGEGEEDKEREGIDVERNEGKKRGCKEAPMSGERLRNDNSRAVVRPQHANCD